MRFLLDEDLDPQLAVVLRALRHDADHIRDLGETGASDERVAELAVNYNVLMTMDLHRQYSEWVKVNEALLSSIRIIRLRFAGKAPAALLAQVRALVWKWSEWEHMLESLETRLITITYPGSPIRQMTSDEIRTLLAERT